jgi:Ca2+-transporting ATPase
LLQKKSKNSGEESEEAAPHHIDPSQDDTNPAPFAQKPLVLASLVDPKSLQSLQAIGGTEGLLSGLGTDTNLGLRSWQHSEAGQRSDPESGNGGGAGAGGDSPESRASAEDRKRVYGINEMPTRKSKSLLLLMWLALKDKVLVRRATIGPHFPRTHLHLSLGSFVNCCGRFPGARSILGFWYPARTGALQ